MAVSAATQRILVDRPRAADLVKGDTTVESIGRDTPLGRTETAPETPYERRPRAVAHGRSPAANTAQSMVGLQGRGAA